MPPVVQPCPTVVVPVRAWIGVRSPAWTPTALKMIAVSARVIAAAIRIALSPSPGVAIGQWASVPRTRFWLGSVPPNDTFKLAPSETAAKPPLTLFLEERGAQPFHSEGVDRRRPPRRDQRRSNRHASRSYQLRSLTFVQPAREPSR